MCPSFAPSRARRRARRRRESMSPGLFQRPRAQRESSFGGRDEPGSTTAGGEGVHAPASLCVRTRRWGDPSSCVWRACFPAPLSCGTDLHTICTCLSTTFYHRVITHNFLASYYFLQLCIHLFPTFRTPLYLHATNILYTHFFNPFYPSRYGIYFFCNCIKYTGCGCFWLC